MKVPRSITVTVYKLANEQHGALRECKKGDWNGKKPMDQAIIEM